jgi:hypothetical protein
VRGFANQLSEYRREVRLRLKADAERNLDQRQIRIAQQLARPIDAPAQDVIMRPHAKGRTKLSGKVHARQSSRCRKIGQPDWIANMTVDELDNPLQAPFLQRSGPSAGVRGRGRAKHRRGTKCGVQLHRLRSSNGVGVNFMISARASILRSVIDLILGYERTH